MKSKIVLLASFLLMGYISNAQTATPKIDKREAKQQKRIQNGVGNGSLTPKEASHLEKREDNIQKAEARDKADGKVTPKERRNLKHRENSVSKDINKKEHNKNVAPR